jgi:LuxR family maltose regulon positive regulatory protein
LVLAELGRWTGFIVALDRQSEWFRYHHLLAEVLRATLLRTAPGLIPALHDRASRWHECRGTPVEAIEHALASGDRGRSAELLSRHLQPLWNRGLQVTIRRWLHAFSDTELVDYPALASGAAWVTCLLGERAEARRYIAILERATSRRGSFPMGESTTQSAIALLKAAFAWDGVSRMHTHAEVAYRLEPAGSGAHERAALYLGASFFLRGRFAIAQQLLEEAMTMSESAANTAAMAVCLLALIDLEAGRDKEAEARIERGLALIEHPEFEGYVSAAPLLAANAYFDMLSGDRKLATGRLARAVSLMPVTSARPWLSILLGILCGRAAVALEDLPLAGSVLAQARRELERYPDAGVLPHMLKKEERAFEAVRGGARVLGEPLTDAELRVLELARTHLTVEEIGLRLSISRNTVKTHLKMIYSKLNAASRGEAITRAQELGLIAH